MAIGFTGISRKGSVIVYAYQLFYACKNNDRLFKYIIDLGALIQMDTFWWMYKVYAAGHFL